MDLSKSRVLDQLSTMDEYDFEHLVADVWEKRGWNTRVTQGSNDRGIDVVAKKSDPFSQKHLIQAKRYSLDNKIGSPDIQQYSSLRHQEDDVDAVVIVTTSSFSSNAKQVAQDLNVKLIDGSALYEMIVETEGEELLEKYISVRETKDSVEATEKKYYSTGKISESSPFKNESLFSKVSSNQGYLDNCPNCDDGAVWFGERSSAQYLKCEDCGATWGTKKSAGRTPFDKWSRVSDTNEGISSVSTDDTSGLTNIEIPYDMYHNKAWKRTKLAVKLPIYVTAVIIIYLFVIMVTGIEIEYGTGGVFDQIASGLGWLWIISIFVGGVIFVVYASKDKNILSEETGEVTPRHPITLGFFLYFTAGLYALSYIILRSQKYQYKTKPRTKASN